MKKIIKIAGTAGMLLAAAIYALTGLGYIGGSRTGSISGGMTGDVQDVHGEDGSSEIFPDVAEAAAGKIAAASDVPVASVQTDAQDAQPLGEASSEQEPEVPGIWVHVCGCVEEPGVYELKEGARAYEAVEAAGGFTDEADDAYMNLAAELTDGIKLYVPAQGEIATGADTQIYAQQAVDGQQGSGDSTASGRIDINTADADALQTLPGIGPARAADIISYRTKNGSFQKAEDIMNVPGIKEAAFAKIKDLIVAR